MGDRWKHSQLLIYMTLLAIPAGPVIRISACALGRCSPEVKSVPLGLRIRAKQFRFSSTDRPKVDGNAHRRKLLTPGQNGANVWFFGEKVAMWSVNCVVGQAGSLVARVPRHVWCDQGCDGTDDGR
jgi:hypothetical protein